MIQTRRAAPVLLICAGICFFLAGGLMLRTRNVMGASYFALGGAFVAIGASAKRRNKRMDAGSPR